MTIKERIAIVESKLEDLSQSIQRIENKLDNVIERRASKAEVRWLFGISLSALISIVVSGLV